MLKFLVIVCLCLHQALGAPVATDVVETDEYFGSIRKCPKGLSDEDLSSCMTEIVKGMSQQFADGLPELDLESIDPYLMNKFEHTLNLRPLVATAKFTKIVIRGLSQYDDMEFHIDTKNRRMSFEIGAPTIRAEANYEIGGNFVLLPMVGNGHASIDIKGGRVRGESTFKIGRNSEGKEILQLDEFKLDLNYDDAKMEVLGLLNRHQTLKRLGPLINRLLNDYNKELYELIRPEFVAQTTDIVKGIINSSISHMPFMTEYF